jgi:hypothetical protein
MPTTRLDMAEARRSALDQAVGSEPAGSAKPFTNINVEVPAKFAARCEDANRLALAVVDRLRRDTGAAGVALVHGLARSLSIAAARDFHEKLFAQVWAHLRSYLPDVEPGVHYQTKAGVTTDGAIPVELYGSSWSFKSLHMDRDALVFSHLYGPVSGFAGGELILVDALAFMQRRHLSFEEAFQWSDEEEVNRKPVLRAQFVEEALATCGANLGVLDADSILFINNAPSSGILHGVTPVRAIGKEHFVREFHRCSVKDARLA